MNARQSWQNEADRWRAWAAYQTSRGEFAEVSLRKAVIAERTIKSFDLEDQTGEAHCVCCLKPLGETSIQPLTRRGIRT